jgi:hypothetical protein
MKTLFHSMASALFALLAAIALGFAPVGARAQPAHTFSQQELDQMLAPIALYPDALLSQILMAATYPMEVIEAARWARDHTDLSGDAAVRAAETESWDQSVKSLLAFPQVLARMRENLQWTLTLGDAFLAQQSQLMDTVQALRRKAQAAGNLRSDDRVSMVQSGPNLLLQPLDPQVVYVPYYDPQLVYGSWWWPAYPPVYLRPWPGYYVRPAYVGAIYWGLPVRISAVLFFGAIDWRLRQVRVAQVNHIDHHNLRLMRQAHASPQTSANRPGAWHHDPEHRRALMLPGRDTPAARPVNTNLAASRQEWHASPPAARLAPTARLELMRAPQPRMAFRPAPRATRPEPALMAVVRHEPVARHHVAQTSAPRAELRSTQIAARPRTGR